jgi:hypothetical protein
MFTRPESDRGGSEECAGYCVDPQGRVSAALEIYGKDY